MTKKELTKNFAFIKNSKDENLIRIVVDMENLLIDGHYAEVLLTSRKLLEHTIYHSLGLDKEPYVLEKLDADKIRTFTGKFSPNERLERDMRELIFYIRNQGNNSAHFTQDIIFEHNALECIQKVWYFAKFYTKEVLKEPATESFQFNPELYRQQNTDTIEVSKPKAESQIKKTIAVTRSIKKPVKLEYDELSNHTIPDVVIFNIIMQQKELLRDSIKAKIESKGKLLNEEYSDKYGYLFKDAQVVAACDHGFIVVVPRRDIAIEINILSKTKEFLTFLKDLLGEYYLMYTVTRDVWKSLQIEYLNLRQLNKLPLKKNINVNNIIEAIMEE